MANNDDSIIIKKIKKGGHGHHGGAWKVAYADFVTAMMAFFLLLWLLSSTSPEQRAGLADYFTPTTGIQDARGIGKKGGLSPSPEGKKRSELTDPGIVVGRLPQGPDPTAPEKKIDNVAKDDNTGIEVKGSATPEEKEEEKKETGEEKASEDAKKGDEGDPGAEEDEEVFQDVQENIMNAFEQTPELKEFQDNVVVAQTPEGLKIDMVDSSDKPMFAPGSALLTDSGKTIMEAISNIVTTTTNKIAISGHTDSSYYPEDENYTSWELSADRANSSRRYLASIGLERERFAKVEGLADQELLLPNEPNSPRNRRISIILMRGKHIQNDDVQATSRGLLSIPRMNKDQQE